MNLSVVISAHNEEKKIEDCLKSVKEIADEIIFVDNKSTDTTSTIAKKYTKKVYTRQNNTMININKNFAISKAESEWILLLDADERVTPELANEIQHITTSKNIDGYKIPRKNIIFGKWIQHSGWYPDYQIRLFRNGKGKYAQQHNHEHIDIKGNIATLTHNILHYNYDSIAQFLNKMFTTYTDDQVRMYKEKGYKFRHNHIITFPFNEFLSRYFARKGYKDGYHGLALALLQSFDHLVVVLKLWEKEKFAELDEKHTAAMVQKEVHSAQKEFSYWVTEADIEKAPPLKKAILKAKRKFA